MTFLRAALHVALSLHRFRSSISTINKARWGLVGHHWLGMFFVSLVLGSVELGNFALCLLGIIYGFFVAFWVWIMNFNNKESLVCSLLVMLRWVGCFSLKSSHLEENKMISGNSFIENLKN